MISWATYVWIGVTLVIWILMIAVALGSLRHRSGDHRMISAGGLTAGTTGLISMVFQILSLTGAVEFYDASGEPTPLSITWQALGYAIHLGQVIFLIGLLLQTSRTGAEKRRIAELEAILRDRDEHVR